MSGGTKNTTKSEDKSTNTVELPAWMTAAGQGLYQRADAAATANPIVGYGGQRTADTSANQQQASSMAASSAGAGRGDLDLARQLTLGASTMGAPTAVAGTPDPTGMHAATARASMVGAAPMATGVMQRPAEGYDPAQQGGAPQVRAQQVGVSDFDGAQAARYMSPYTEQVQGRTLLEMMRQNGIEHAGLNDSAEAARAYGGTRHALLESEQGKNQNANMLDYLAESNAAAYGDAQQQFERDRSARFGADTANQGANLQADTTSASFIDQMLGRNMAARDAASQFGATARNSAAGADADRGQQATLANQELEGTFRLSDQAAGNAASEANAGRRQSAGEFNADAANRMGAANADRSFDASKTNANLYQTMLDRMLTGGRQFGDIGTASSNMSTADINNLQRTGAVDQATENDKLQAAYDEFLRMQDAPMDRYRDLMAILSGTPRNVSTNGTSNGTSTSKQSGSLINTLMSAAQIGASIASDRRLKRDVLLLDREPDGLGVYRYGYLWDAEEAPPRIGVMADEVAELRPWALGPVVGGYATVNYSELGAAR